MISMSIELIKKYEPIAFFSRAENFYPMRVEPYVKKSAGIYFWNKSESREEMVVPPVCLTIEDLAFFGRDYYLVYAAKLPADEDVIKELCRLWALNKGAKGLLTDTLTGLVNKIKERGVGPIIDIGRAVLPMSLPSDVHAQAKKLYGGPHISSPAYHYRYTEKGGFQIVQYWFFYAYNDFFTAHRGANDHEADWEQITIFMRDGRPLYAAYASHHEVVCRPWEAVPKKAGNNHPLVYVGAGSHASYFEAGDYLGGKDRAPGDGFAIGPGGDYEWQPVELNLQSWLNFSGLWGSYAHEHWYDERLKGAHAPAGPKYERDATERLAWRDPLAWANLATG